MLSKLTMQQQRMMELADYLDSLPRVRFNMGSWLFQDRRCDEQTLLGLLASGHTCGTVGCVAGYTLLCFATETEKMVKQGWNFPYEVSEMATELLGLGDDEARELFTPRDPGGGEEVLSFWSTVTNRQAARVVRHLAVTGVVDWTRRGEPE